jgi:hypothetical protein
MLSIVDVKCVDKKKWEYVVEMQVFNTPSFEERVVYNAWKPFVLQLPSPERYADLGEVVGVTICNFKLWPGPEVKSEEEQAVPMLSRWRMQEQHTGVPGLPQIQYAFLELPKYTGGPHPKSMIDKWACFFREAGSLDVIPPELDEEPFREAFEVARITGFNPAELVAYDREKMAEGDARGRIELAEGDFDERNRTPTSETNRSHENSHSASPSPAPLAGRARWRPGRGGEGSGLRDLASADGPGRPFLPRRGFRRGAGRGARSPEARRGRPAPRSPDA